MKNKIFSAVTTLLLYTAFALGQEGVSINNSGAHADPSAILDVSSEEKGFLPPRLTEGQRDAITNPALGLIVFNTTSNELEIQVGTSGIDWEPLSPTNDNSVGSTVQVGISTIQEIPEFQPTRVDFANAVFNDGGHFSLTGDEYIVPAAGVYHFSTGITLTGLQLGDMMMVYIKVNGTTMTTAYINPTGTGMASHITGTPSVTLKLFPGDKVTVYVENWSGGPKDILPEAEANWFSAHRLY